MLRSKSNQILPLSLAVPNNPLSHKYQLSNHQRAQTTINMQSGRKKQLQKPSVGKIIESKQNKYNSTKNLQAKTASIIKKTNQILQTQPNLRKNSKDLNKIKQKYMGNTSSHTTSVQKLNLKDIHNKCQTDIENNPQQSLTFRDKTNDKKQQAPHIQIQPISNKQFIDSIKINLIQPPVNASNNPNSINNSIINNLYALSPSKYESPSKLAKQSLISVGNNNNKGNNYLLKKYDSAHKIKKYQYLPGSIHPNSKYHYNIISQNNKRHIENSYEKYKIKSLRESVQAEKQLNQYKTELQNLKYHYYIDPNVIHRPSLKSFKSHSHSHSFSLNHSRSNTFGIQNMLSRQKVRKLHKQRQSNNRSIQRIQYNEQEMERQVHILGEKCKNMLRDINNYEEIYLKRHRYGIHLPDAESISEIERQMRKKLRDRSIENEIQIKQQKERQRQRQISKKQRQEIMQQQRRKRKYLQDSLSKQISHKSIIRKSKQLEYQNQMQTEREMENKIIKEKQRRKQLELLVEKQKIQALNSQRQYIRAKQRSVFPFNLYPPQSKISDTKQISEKCNCKYECDCKYMNQLTNSRLQRINSKLEQYISRNIENKGFKIY